MTVVLKGLRVLNTRPHQQNLPLAQQLQAAQADSIYFPVLEITAADKQWLNLLPDLECVDSALFISANAVNYCFSILADHQISWPQHIKIIAIGQGTARALAHYNIRIDDLPAAPDSEHVLDLPSLQQIEGQSVLLFKGEGGREVIEQALLAQKARLTMLAVYQRSIPDYPPEFINSLWHDDAVDIILLTSEQSIKNLFTLFGKEAHAWLCGKPCLVISKRLADIAVLAGIKKIIISHPNHMMDALFDYYQGINPWPKR